MITISEAAPNELPVITSIAHQTWPTTYGNILSKNQLDYMLGKFYSPEGLNENLANHHRFLLAKDNGIPLGFASYLLHYQNDKTTRIPKIYILPEAQGKGIGQLLIAEISRLAIKNGDEKLQLNVNRSNVALGFYQKLGFTIVAQEDIALDHGYLMEDYIMEKQLP